MSNIDDFNRGAASILSYLYDKFPEKVTLEIPKQFPDESPEVQSIFGATVNFLNDERFISVDTIAYGLVYCGVRLTSKGLAVLNAMPDAITESKSISDKLKSALKDGSATALKAIITQLITIGVFGVVKHLG